MFLKYKPWLYFIFDSSQNLWFGFGAIFFPCFLPQSWSPYYVVDARTWVRTRLWWGLSDRSTARLFLMLIGCYWNVGGFSRATGRRKVPTRSRHIWRATRWTEWEIQRLLGILHLISFALFFSYVVVFFFFFPFLFSSASIFIGLKPRILIWRG